MTDSFALPNHFGTGSVWTNWTSANIFRSPGRPSAPGSVLNPYGSYKGEIFPRGRVKPFPANGRQRCFTWNIFAVRSRRNPNNHTRYAAGFLPRLTPATRGELANRLRLAKHGGAIYLGSEAEPAHEPRGALTKFFQLTLWVKFCIFTRGSPLRI